MVVLNGNRDGNNISFCWNNVICKLPTKQIALITDAAGGEIERKQMYKGADFERGYLGWQSLTLPKKSSNK